MADIKEILGAYFAWPEDVDKKQPGEMAPDYTQGNQVDFLVDGAEYFTALREEVDALQTGGVSKHPYFFFTNWYLGLVQGPDVQPTIKGSGAGSTFPGNIGDVKNAVPFQLGDGSFTFKPLIDELDKLAEEGVDVRSLIWASAVSFSGKVGMEKAGQIWQFNLHSLLSVKELRARPHLKAKDRYKKILLNTLAHPISAMHLKLVVCGDDEGRRAYLSGLDFVSNRIADWKHDPAKQQYWHDVGVRVQGPATNAIYNWFRLLWNEQLTRTIDTFHVGSDDIPSHFEDTPRFDKETPPAPPLAKPGTQHVQVLRTSPQMHFDYTQTKAAPTVIDEPVPLLNPLIKEVTGCFIRLAAAFRKDEMSFAKDGIFEFRLAQRKAIGGAQKYIYIEDQGFQSKDLMQWLGERLAKNPELKIIMVHGADPTDPPNAFLPQWMKKLMEASGAAGRVVFYEVPGRIIHSKVTIIDDQWAAVGSANFYNRSLYTDGECSVSIVDQPAPGAPTFAQRLRAYLWGEHCELPPSKRHALLNLEESIGVWNPAWGTSPPDVLLSKRLERMEVPFKLCDPGAGTVEAQAGSHVLTGTDTDWTPELQGKMIRIENDKPGFAYWVVKVDSPTSMSIALRYDGKSPYQGVSGKGKVYRVEQPGRFLLDAFPAFDPVSYAQLDADSRQEY